MCGVHLQNKLYKTIDDKTGYGMSKVNEVECVACGAITTVYSHVASTVHCPTCQAVLAKPTGGSTKLVLGKYVKEPVTEN